MKTNLIPALVVVTLGARASSLASIIMLCFLFACAGSLRAQDGLQFNVPYACNDGATYVVHKCVTGPKGEMCFYQAEGESERFNTRAAVVSQMTKMCKVKSGPSPAAAAAQSSSDLQLNTPYQCAGELTLTAVQCQKQNGQDYCLVKVEQGGKFLMEVPKPQAEIATQLKACKAGTTFIPPYLAEFPKASDVVQAMVTGTPKDNVTRAMGALYQLTEIINVLSAQRGTSGYSPDEKKLLDNYSKMQSDVVQAAAKILPGQQFNVATNPYHFSRSDPKFGFEGIPVWTTFLSPSLQARFAQIVGGNDPHYIASVEQQKRTAMQQLQANAGQGGSPFIRNDPGTLAARRCVELGGSDAECIGKGLWGGLMDLAGVNTEAMSVPSTHGVVMNGPYTSGSGLGISFGPENVAVTGCGKLVPNSHSYTITKKQNQLLINVKSEPSSFVLSMGNDGKLSGPGPADITGQIITGYRSYTEYKRRVSDNTIVPGSEHLVQVPIYAPKTERCAIGTFAQAPAPPPDKSELINGLTASLNSMMHTGPTGLRMTGRYTNQGGLALEFAEDAVTIDCGAAHVKQAYIVENAATQIMITVKNGSSPFTVALQPNGALSGSGSADVAGRVVTGSSADALTYAPRNARCTIGILTSKAGN